MNTKPVTRRQGVDDSAVYTAVTAIDCSNDIDRARQEFKADQDINTMMAKFGMMSGQTSRPIYGETNYDLDLQNALTAIRDVKAAHGTLPEDVREKYPTWQLLLEAIENGEYETPEQEALRTKAEDALAKEQRLADIREAMAPPAPPAEPPA